MKNLKNYNKYIFISTFTRNIIDIYSVIYLYQQKISIEKIIYIYALVYFFGSFVSAMSLKIGNRIGYKYILIISSIFTGLSFYILRNNKNPYIIALSLSLSMFTYHPIKHYYGINLLPKQKEITHVLILTYLATLVSSFLAIKKINLLYLIIISIIGAIPAIFIKTDKSRKIIYPKHISKEKILFFIFDQFKIIFLLLEPLYLYLLSTKITYVGIFNIILNIASIIYLYIISKKINLTKNYKYLNLIFSLVLFLKLSTQNKNFLLVLAFFEGMGIKTNELVSTMNLYNNHKLSTGYLIISETIFCIVRATILIVFYLFKVSLLTSLYILLVGIIILSFTYHPQNKEKI